MHTRKSWDVLQVRAENNERFDDVITWKTFSALLVLCEGNQSATGGFPSQRPVTWNLVVFDLRLNKRFNRQSKRSLITLFIWILNKSLDMEYNSVLDISASICCYMSNLTCFIWKGTYKCHDLPFSLHSNAHDKCQMLVRSYKGQPS